MGAAKRFELRQAESLILSLRLLQAGPARPQTAFQQSLRCDLEVEFGLPYAGHLLR